ncbi:splicing factor 45 [Sitodiplosis mosellana]|uniref:splicing factor 45 n=1 Tax=Sitodiplosis mosellana TaxID=263140 RepID=UPI00244418F1|nr:splicing factor 45 [Sitodiplosis mosellana]
MDLYDDLDAKQRIDGWSPGLKLMQTQMALKKAIVPPPAKKELPKRTAPLLAPITILKTKGRPNSDSDDHFKSNESSKTHHKKQPTTITTQALAPPNKAANDYDWNVIDEYNPLWPNEYEKIIKERRERRDNDRKRRNNRNENRDATSPQKFSGFAGRSEDLDDYKKSPPAQRTAGATIAPPPSLQESTPIIPALQNTNAAGSYGSGSVAAKIMAKYGFKDGQGLGKQEQGMSVALQVEKTSKRGGRIIHENEFMLPPKSSTPPLASMPPPTAPVQQKDEPSITEIMKAPSKVVLLRNMVGAGDVDNELEGEVKDECNTKYGDVVSVIIFELKNAAPEEAVRIFVEFKRIESAIKAVVDLNGRFFGGRQVKAGFYPFEKFQKHYLTD